MPNTLCTGALDSAFADLHARGYFKDPVKQAVEEVFLPWLQAQVARSPLNSACTALSTGVRIHLVLHPQHCARRSLLLNMLLSFCFDVTAVSF